MKGYNRIWNFIKSGKKNKLVIVIIFCILVIIFIFAPNIFTQNVVRHNSISEEKLGNAYLPLEKSGINEIIDSSVFDIGNNNDSMDLNEETDFLYQIYEYDTLGDSSDNAVTNYEAKFIERYSGEKVNLKKLKRLTFDSYIIKNKDTLNKIAKKFNLDIDTIISVNLIKSKLNLKVGQELFIPNQKGVFYTVKTGDTISKIAEKYKTNNVAYESILYVNSLLKDNDVTPGDRIFIPGGKLSKEELDRIFNKSNLAEYVIPVIGRLSSNFGLRIHPFNRSMREFHPGIDFAAPYGAPIKATKAGRVIFAGWCGGYGKLVILDHGNGMETRYGHMSNIIAKYGQFVKKGQIIGKVGSTGFSTGPHLHFEIRKNGNLLNPLKGYLRLGKSKK